MLVALTTRFAMNISIILSTANRCDSLRQTLLCLANVRVPFGMHCKLILVDNASTDSTKEVADSIDFQNMEYRYVYEARPGKSIALNSGISRSSGEILFFLDDDVRPPINWIEGMCGQIISGKTAAVVGGISLAPHLKRKWMTSLLKSMFASTENQNPDNPDLVRSQLLRFT